MRSASSGSADRSAICVTLTLPHENAVELQNMARSCAGRLRELGVLAVQVGNTAAISLQPSPGNACQLVHRGGTRDRRQQTLNATRTNIAQYLGANISSFQPVVGSVNAAESDIQNNSVYQPNVAALASVSSGSTLDHSVNMAAESSPHIVNLLQHDILSRSGCLSSPMLMSSASDVRPKKRARRRTPSAAAEVSVPLSMFGAADNANSVFSLQQPSRCVDAPAGVSPVHNMPVEQFKVPEIRRRKACTSRKACAAKSQQLPVAGQALPNTLTDLFNTGYPECSKPSEAGRFHATASSSMGDGFQINGVNPYHRIPVMTAGWQQYATHSVPSRDLYQSLPARYPNEYGHPQLRCASNIDYLQMPAGVNRASGLGSYRNITPGSPVVFVSNANQVYLQGEHVPSSLPKQMLRWPSVSESHSLSVPYGSHNSSMVPSVCAVYNTTHDKSGGLPVSHIMQQQLAASRSGAPAMPDSSKPRTETDISASEKMVQLSISSDIDRIQNVPVCDTPIISSLSVGCIDMTPPSATYQRANGLFADVHSSALAFHEHTGHVKVNGDVECLQLTDHPQVSKCEAVFEKFSAVTVSPYAPHTSSVSACVGDMNCVPERQLQHPSIQLPVKIQHGGLADFEDTDVSGCATSVTPNIPKISVSSVLPPPGEKPFPPWSSKSYVVHLPQ